MINKFKKDHWYRFNKKSPYPLLNYMGGELSNYSGHMDFMLDGEWHQCKEIGCNSNFAAFYDSSDPNTLWPWGDPRVRKERLYMFDEMSPTLMNIKKLKELKNQLDKTK